jgi:phage baseplate assembly protein gpV
VTASDLFDSIARIARHEVAARPTAAAGRVTAVHGTGAAAPDHAVDVELRDALTLLPRVPIAVGALGAVVTPTVGDLVLVVFAEGDVHGPVVVGRLHHAALPPPAHEAGQVVLALPPGADQPGVAMTLDGGAPSVELTIGELTISVTDHRVEVASGQLRLRLDAAGTEQAELAVGEATLRLSASGDVSLSTSGALKLEAATVEITGQAKVAVTGGLVEIN